jgi:hypothetical protein
VTGAVGKLICRGAAGRLALALAAAALLGGCGLDVELPDLFLLTRTGQGSKLTLLVNDSGAVHCNGAKGKMLSSSMLIQARALSGSLASDAKQHLDLPPGPGTVFSYQIKLKQGTIRFSDRDTLHHKALAQAELFAAQAAQQACGLSG